MCAYKALIRFAFIQMALPIITIVLFVAYSILIIYYWQSWKAIPGCTISSTIPGIKISVIIPARNEERNIGKLLSALDKQSYPKDLVEVIVIDDHSTDKTIEEAQKFSVVRLFQLKEDNINSYKKKAIETGIAKATGELIVTTDADCLPGNEWLQTIASFKQESDSVLIVAPVVYENNSSLLQIFQTLDFLVLQGITGAAVYKRSMAMCNGANLSYERKVFDEVSGFSGIDQIASGDDMLLMHKIWEKHPDQIHYLKSKEAIVSTQPMKTWKEFFDQRIRWASKAKYYADKKIFGVLLLVYLFNLSSVVLLVAGFFNYCYWFYLLGLWIAKTIIEYPFVYSVAHFFNKQSLLKYFFFFQPLHMAYTIISGLSGQFGKYEWKGRKVK